MSAGRNNLFSKTCAILDCQISLHVLPYTLTLKTVAAHAYIGDSSDILSYVRSQRYYIAIRYVNLPFKNMKSSTFETLVKLTFVYFL